jgi:hypothetical protein
MDIRTFARRTADSVESRIAADNGRRRPPTSTQSVRRLDTGQSVDVNRPPGSFKSFAFRRFVVAILWVVTFFVLVVAILLAGIGIAAVVARHGTADTWNLWSAVRQSFESINAVFSGLAFFALIVTFWMQLRGLQIQRTELAMQREALTRSNAELHRSAEAELRMLHIELTKLSIADPALAEVWPKLRPDLTPEQTRQYLFANLVYQHFRLALQIGQYGDDEILIHLRYVFSSPVMRDFWADSINSRTQSVLPDTEEGRFMQLADHIYRTTDPAPLE